MEENEVETEQKVRVIRKRSAYPAPPKPVNWFAWAAMPLVFILGLGSGWLIWGISSVMSAPLVNIPEKVSRADVSVDDDPSSGPADAPVTIVEFSDYQCPYCIRWYQTVYSRLMADYKDKIRFVYRDLPLASLHPDAQSAAEAANCAGEQGAYWPYHDALFGAKYGLGAQAYGQYASELNLDVASFNTCVSERRYEEEVNADARAALGLGISSTPTFYINGLLVVGAQPYEVFQQIIDKELAGEIPKD